MDFRSSNLVLTFLMLYTISYARPSTKFCVCIFSGGFVICFINWRYSKFVFKKTPNSFGKQFFAQEKFLKLYAFIAHSLKAGIKVTKTV